MAVSPFDGVNRIRFKGSPSLDSQPRSSADWGSPETRIWFSNCRKDSRTLHRGLQLPRAGRYRSRYDLIRRSCLLPGRLCHHRSVQILGF